MYNNMLQYCDSSKQPGGLVAFILTLMIYSVRILKFLVPHTINILPEPGLELGIDG